ncbi:Down syndrome cell adhesion molecule homolog isoform X2 [Gigantopelta aegis]|uniref:Down syndrome cell adhesion molecule homolog isoform X2 n=1 Tax=Gigantopelta aegis TaxID=1735272 RepID=UPI001B8898F6|nr:Down syndrome cell adhesion molecule homolog isoform X2 [Gigantopelta aegis]
MAFSRIVFEVSLLVSLIANFTVEGADTETYCMDPANPGDSTTLTCTITGKINGGIRWIRPIASNPRTEVAKCDTRNTFCLYPGNITGYKAVAVSPTRNSLTIDSFNPVIDAGEWTCQDGMVGLVRRKCNKTVTAGPHDVALASPEYVTEGDNLTLNCTARCNPSPCSFSWTFENNTVSSGALLSLTNISNTQYGNVYTCTVNNTAIPNSTTIQFTLTIKQQ